MSRLPEFIIVGAMKSATSTLYEQLSRQTGIFLPKLKEPNFFSDDEQYARGLQWYSELFSPANGSDIKGEASTHYTKLPTYPQTISRMRNCLTQPRLIYVMRDPVDRLISQYIHQWSQSEIRCGLDEAVDRHPELVAYSCYAYQLSPFFEAFGRKSILPVFFDRLLAAPQEELERVCNFIGYKGQVKWDNALAPRNASAERIRKFPLYDLVVEHPLALTLRRSFVPKALRTKVRQFLSMKTRPTLTSETRRKLVRRFEDDLEMLGDWLGVRIDLENFHSVTAAKPLEWR